LEAAMEKIETKEDAKKKSEAETEDAEAKPEVREGAGMIPKFV
jgi:hypothetical protein